MSNQNIFTPFFFYFFFFFLQGALENIQVQLI